MKLCGIMVNNTNLKVIFRADDYVEIIRGGNTENIYFTLERKIVYFADSIRTDCCLLDLS